MMTVQLGMSAADIAAVRRMALISDSHTMIIARGDVLALCDAADAQRAEIARLSRLAYLHITLPSWRLRRRRRG